MQMKLPPEIRSRSQRVGLPISSQSACSSVGEHFPIANHLQQQREHRDYCFWEVAALGGAAAIRRSSSLRMQSKQYLREMGSLGSYPLSSVSHSVESISASAGQD